MERLFESENLVIKVRAQSDKSRWVVTFDNYGIGHGFERLGFGEAFFADNGVSALHVMGRREDWYQYPEIKQALAAVREFTKGASRVMTYGSSMGGYAAVRFAGPCAAHIALALSPQYSIDPRRAPFEKRWLSDSRRIEFLREIDGPITSETRTIIAYDPRTDDRRHVELIKGDIDIEEIPAPFTGHPVTTFLSEIGLLKSMVISSLEGTVDAKECRKLIRTSRSNSSIYYASLAEFSKDRNEERAKSLAEHAVSLKPDSPLALLSLTRVLFAGGDVSGAIRASERMVELAGRDYHYLVPLADYLSAEGRHEEALLIAREVLELGDNQKSPHLNAWLGFIASSAGEDEESRHALERAIQLDPSNEKYVQAFRRIHTPATSSFYNRVKMFLRQKRALGRPRTPASSRQS